MQIIIGFDHICRIKNTIKYKYFEFSKYKGITKSCKYHAMTMQHWKLSRNTDEAAAEKIVCHSSMKINYPIYFGNSEYLYCITFLVPQRWSKPVIICIWIKKYILSSLWKCSCQVPTKNSVINSVLNNLRWGLYITLSNMKSKSPESYTSCIYINIFVVNQGVYALCVCVSVLCRDICNILIEKRRTQHRLWRRSWHLKVKHRSTELYVVSDKCFANIYILCIIKYVQPRKRWINFRL